MILGEPEHLWSMQTRARSPVQAGRGRAAAPEMGPAVEGERGSAPRLCRHLVLTSLTRVNCLSTPKDLGLTGLLAFAEKPVAALFS